MIIFNLCALYKEEFCRVTRKMLEKRRKEGGSLKGLSFYTHKEEAKLILVVF